MISLRPVQTACFSAVAAGLLLLAGCTSPGKAALDANVPLAPAPAITGASSGVVVWRAPDIEEYERHLVGYYIPDATIYTGPQAEFSGLSESQKTEIAAALTTDVRAAFRQKLKLVNQPGPNIFTIELIVAKVVPPQAVNIMNGPYDWSAAVVGMPNVPTMGTGTMTISGKFVDSQTNKLLVGFVAPVSPQFMEMGSSSDPTQALKFADVASKQFASNLVAAILRQREISRMAVK